MEEKYLLLLEKHAANNLSSAEREDLLHWAGDDPERSAYLGNFGEVLATANTGINGPEVDTAAAWMRLQQRISAHHPPMAQKLTFKQLLARTAATAIVSAALIIGYLEINKPATILVSTNEVQQKAVVLPDGTKVHLNPNSSLSWPADAKPAGQRRVKLKGEAFFEVTKDPGRPLIIETGPTQTKVQETSFTVKHQKTGLVEVSVKTGKAEFWEARNRKNRILLLPGETGVFKKGSQIKLSSRLPDRERG